MVSNTTCKNGYTTCCVYEFPYIRMYPPQINIANLRTRSFDMKYQMNINF